MADRSLQRGNSFNLRLAVALATIAGSVTPDIGHGLSLVFPEIPWGATHYWSVFFIWLFITCLVGFIAIIFLGRLNHDN